MNVKILSISDLHGYLPEMEECDIVTISGDIVPLDVQRNLEESGHWFVNRFCKWAMKIPCKHVVFIAGNHDFFLEGEFKNFTDLYKTFGGKEPPKEMKNKIHYLIDSEVKLMNLTIYGTPWCGFLSNWAFWMCDKGLDNVFSNIPDCDILLTHDAPKSNDCSKVLQEDAYNYMQSYGNEFLTHHVGEKNIKYCICGHIHTGNHEIGEVNGTKFVNASIKNENYQVKYKPIKIEID